MVTIEVAEGDIAAEDVDAVVNAANNHFWMGSGVAGALKARGGAAIEREAMAQGPVEPGECVITSAGRLPARKVIHAAVMGQDLRTSADIIARATANALKLADAHSLTSIALPALGTGLGHVAPGAAADAMMEAVAAHLKGGKTALKRVVFVLYLDDAYRAFTDTLKRVGGIQ